jgi:putative membrane protein
MGRRTGALVVAAALACAVEAHAAHRTGEGDAKTAGVLLVSNAGEVAVGQSAAARVTDPEVRDYALRLATDHAEANTRLLGVLEVAGIRPVDSPERDRKTEDAEHETNQVWRARADEVDLVFVQLAVEDHQQDLADIDGKLLPAVTDPRLRDEILAERAVVEDHLAQARNLWVKLTLPPM